jgi:CysZ protein
MMSTLRTGDGVRAFFGGCRFVLTTSRIWPWAIVPVLVALVLGTGLGALGIVYAIKAAATMVVGSSAWLTVGRVALSIALGAVAVVAALAVALSLAQPLSGFALDRIVRAQEAQLGQRSAWPEQSMLNQLTGSVAVSLTSLLVGLPALAALTVADLVVPPAAVLCVPLKVVVSALMLAWDLLDYPLGIRGASLSDRIRFVRTNFTAVVAFGLAGAAMLLLPGVGLLLLPMGAAGATRLVGAADRAGQAQATPSSGQEARN